MHNYNPSFQKFKNMLSSINIGEGKGQKIMTRTLDKIKKLILHFVAQKSLFPKI